MFGRWVATATFLLVLMMQSAQAQLTVDPETIVPLPPRFDMEPPASDVPPEMAGFEGAWIGTWQAQCVVARGRARRLGASQVKAFTDAGGNARFELLHGVPGDGHLLRLYPERWRAVADQYLSSLDR